MNKKVPDLFSYKDPAPFSIGYFAEVEVKPAAGILRFVEGARAVEFRKIIPQ